MYCLCQPQHVSLLSVNQPLRAQLEIGFDYTRSLGPTLSQFMTALAGRRILGARGADGRVHVPPFEYDPQTGEPPGELVEVGSAGTVTTWSWAARPVDGQPLEYPFAWALIRLDGANTALLHTVDAGTTAAMRTGMRVRARWADSPAGHIRDIVCFEPWPGPAAPHGRGAWPAGEPVTMVTTPVRMGMRVAAVWKPREQWGTTAENIDHFRPTGEPDAPYESYAHHL